MKTIIYFYHSNDETNFITEKWKEEDYCLIRAGVPPFVWRNQWMRQKQQDDNPVPEQKQRDENPVPKQMHQVGKPVKETATTNSKQGLESTSAFVLTRVREWQQALLFLSDNPNRCSCVYEKFLQSRLSPNVWNPFPVPGFTNYREEQWVTRILPYGRWDREIILGTADYLPKLLMHRARKMQSLQWVVRSSQYTEFFQDFVEEFLEETGIAIQLYVADDGMPMTGSFLQSREPVNVWDFSGEKKVFVAGIPSGSVWMDMDAMEEKEERIANRKPGITYFSLKKLWNQLQKDSDCLDTPYKNGYNT